MEVSDLVLTVEYKMSVGVFLERRKTFGVSGKFFLFLFSSFLSFLPRPVLDADRLRLLPLSPSGHQNAHDRSRLNLLLFFFKSAVVIHSEKLWFDS